MLSPALRDAPVESVTTSAIEQRGWHACHSPRVGSNYPLGMDGHFLVRHARGPAWDPSRGRREQAGWNEHAAFIDQLSATGKVLLGGPIDNVDGHDTVLVVHAATERDARDMFADDPWSESILTIERVERWTLWIGADKLPSP